MLFKNNFLLIFSTAIKCHLKLLKLLQIHITGIFSARAMPLI